MQGIFYYEFYCGIQVLGYLVVIMLFGIGDKFKGFCFVFVVYLYSWILLNDF